MHCLIKMHARYKDTHAPLFHKLHILNKDFVKALRTFGLALWGITLPEIKSVKLSP